MSFVFAFQSKMGNSQFISLLTYGFDDTVLPSDHVNVNFRNYMDNFSAAEKQWKATGVSPYAFRGQQQQSPPPIAKLSTRTAYKQSPAADKDIPAEPIRPKNQRRSIDRQRANALSA